PTRPAPPPPGPTPPGLWLPRGVRHQHRLPQPRQATRPGVCLPKGVRHQHHLPQPPQAPYVQVSDSRRVSDTNITCPSHRKPHTSRCLTPEGCQTPSPPAQATASHTYRPLTPELWQIPPHITEPTST